MAERAYSLELKESISAKYASKLSCEGKLLDERQFRCSDTNCNIRLTCTNWGKNGKRYYFTPSSLDELHIIGCTEMSISEAKDQAKKEADSAKEIIKKNGIIQMTKSISRTASKITVTEDVSSSKNSDVILSTPNNKTRRESRHLYSIASFVDLYEDTTVDNLNQFISIDNLKISLDELFLSAKNHYFPQETNRIFYGKALIRTASFGKNMLEIEFQNSNLPKIYSNITIMSKRPTTSKLLVYLDKENLTTVYFRGKLINKGTKLESFNDKVYKDIYFK
ncbi:hypothetical protein [Bacillus pumilus]|uniref:hypothetical protein n=1 Tax=Bacillus pumilus TaxID=1408 RepID=UPI002FFED9BA